MLARVAGSEHLIDGKETNPAAKPSEIPNNSECTLLRKDLVAEVVHILEATC